MINNIYKILLLSSFSFSAQAAGNELALARAPADITHSIPTKEKSPHELSFERSISDAADASFKKNRLIDMRAHQHSKEEFIASVNYLWKKVHDNLDAAMITAEAMGKDREWVIAEFSRHYNDRLLGKTIASPLSVNLDGPTSASESRT